MSELQRYESGLVVENRGHVRVLTLDRPERRNALSSELQADLVDQLLDAGEGGIVSADPSLDITQEVLNRLRSTASSQ